MDLITYTIPEAAKILKCEEEIFFIWEVTIFGRYVPYPLASTCFI
jgi:hypothetical protein